MKNERSAEAGVTDVDSRSKPLAESRPSRAMAATGMWLIAAVGFLAWLGFEAATLGPAACELAPGSSLYGDASWSWFQLGQVCTWELLPEIAMELERGPGLNRWIFVVLLTAWFASLRLLGTPRR
jgi:hypothetical protein